MSLLTAILLAGSPAAMPAPTPVEIADEIVVIGQRLHEWRGNWSTKKGIVSCRTTKSTKDREIDAIGCASLVSCVTPLVPQLQSIADMKLPKAERNRRLNAAAQSIGPCLTERRGDAIADLAARRKST